MHFLTTVTPPTDEVVTLAEARAHLRFYDGDDTSEDGYIQSLIDTAVSNIDGPTGWLGRALTEQTITLTLDHFPEVDMYGRARRIDLPLPPLVSVDDLKYTNSSGTEATYSAFRTFGVGAHYGGYIMPALSADWPVTAEDPGAVRITFTAGYTSVPKAIKHAILLLVSHWYEHREAAIDTGAKFGMLELPIGVDRLLNPLRMR